MRVVVFGAHPDDQELGMGGTIARLARDGHEVTLVDMTDGEPTPEGSPELRAREAAEAARILGVSRIQLGLRNRELVNDIESRHAVATAIRTLRPDILFAHHGLDSHPDHVAASALVDGGRFAARLTKCDLSGEPWHARALFQYFSIHLRAVPQPSLVADTSGFASTKRRSILAYHSQFVACESNRAVPDWIDAQGIYFGSRIGTETAEPFFSPACIGFDFGWLARPEPSVSR
ncbi:MAG: bacillithiol biosynthesis deacetylase BshB1 [Phycisphaerales bacterium]|nr:bacillithiol biosynthesis deacetylase BshB1 [Phycisphaerales bacterium]